MKGLAGLAGAVLLVLPCLASDPAGGFILPTPEDAAVFRLKGDAYAKALDVVMDRGIWDEALALAAGRSGLPAGAPGRPFPVRILLETSRFMDNNHYLAYASWAGAEGKVHVAMDRMVENPWARADFVRVVAHELTHCLQGFHGGGKFYANPPWLVEGMANYAADVSWADGYYRATFPYVPALYDGLMRQGNGAAYMRGTLLFRFLESRCGSGCVQRFIQEVVLSTQTYQAAAGRAAGVDWKTLAILEQRWAEDYIHPPGSAPVLPVVPSGPSRAARTGLPFEVACANELGMFCAEAPPEGRKACLKKNRKGLMRDCRAALDGGR